MDNRVRLQLGATFTEYMMVFVLIGIVMFLLGPTLFDSAVSLYDRNRDTFNTADAGPFYKGGTSKSGSGKTGAIPPGKIPDIDL